MKKRIIALSILTAFCTANLALAAENTTEDLNLRVQKLEEKVEGTVKANEDLKKSNSDLNLHIKKMETDNEYSLKVSGIARYRYERVSEARPTYGQLYYYGTGEKKVQDFALFYLFLDKKIDKDSYIHASTGNQQQTGQGDGPYQFYEGYYAHKEGNLEWAVGRFLPTAHGKFLFMGTGPWADGIRLTYTGQDTVTTYHQVKIGERNLHYLNVDSNLSKLTSATLNYVVDTDKADYNSPSLGIEYKGIPNINVKGTFGINTGKNAKDYSNTYNDNAGSPMGMVLQAKYKGANPFIKGSAGVWINYRYAEPGYDPANYADAELAAGPFNWTYPTFGGALNNLKGFEFGIEATVAPQAVLQIRYAPLQALKTGLPATDWTPSSYPAGFTPQPTQKSQRYFIASLTTYF